MSYVVDKVNGIYRYVFYAPESHSQCYFKVNIVGDDNSSDTVHIFEAKKNGIVIPLSKVNECGPFKTEMQEKVILELKTDRTEYFASGVEVTYAD